MLKKGRWLKRWKQLMLKKTEFLLYMIDDMAGTAILDYKDELSPNESVESILEAMDKMESDLEWGGKYDM